MTAILVDSESLEGECGLYILKAKNGDTNVIASTEDKNPLKVACRGQAVGPDNLMNQDQLLHALNAVNDRGLTDVRVYPISVGKSLNSKGLQMVRKEQLIRSKGLTMEEVELLRS